MPGKVNQFKDLRLTYSAPAGLTVNVYSENLTIIGAFSLARTLTFPATTDPDSYTLPLDVGGLLESTLLKFQFTSTGPVRLLDAYLRWRPIGVWFNPGAGEVWEMQDLYLNDPHHFREVELVLQAPGLYCDVLTELPGQSMAVQCTTALNTIGATGRLPLNFRLPGFVTGRMLRIKLYALVPGANLPARVFAGRVFARSLGSAPPGDWTWIDLPIEPTPQDWLTAKLPITPTPPEYSWMDIPVDEVA
jgi:hypothetical protein